LLFLAALALCSADLRKAEAGDPEVADVLRATIALAEIAAASVIPPIAAPRILLFDITILHSTSLPNSYHIALLRMDGQGDSSIDLVAVPISRRGLKSVGDDPGIGALYLLHKPGDCWETCLQTHLERLAHKA
jgi:hypothetical protein